MLRKIIEDEIRAHGPIRLDRYMEICLSHPEYGYYTSQQPFGRKGDFITAPEISQMFGELVGLWLIHMWQAQGAPERFALVELGPGRGTLMADILRVAAVMPAFLRAARVFLLESSPRLRVEQKERLGKFDIAHIDGLDDMPDMPLYLVANEFFDALPIRQFVKNDFGWQERLVAEGLAFSLGKTRDMPDLDRRFRGIETGRIVETRKEAEAMSAVITKKITTRGGAAIIIDYGDYDGVGDTFQAVKQHKMVDPFAGPGKADLTAHVRFGELVQNGVEPGFATQGEFLTRMGIDERRKVLEKASGKPLGLEQARLIGDDEMGNAFKVLAMWGKPMQHVPGFL